MEKNGTIQYRKVDWQKVFDIALVLTMIYHFGRTTGHQACNPKSPFLALVRLLQYQKEKLFLHSHHCWVLPRRGWDTDFLCQSTSRAEEPAWEAV